MSDSNTSSLRPIIFAGPSAVGKGTIIDMLKAEFPSKVGHSVSHTTRAPRSGEVDGVHYHFTTVDNFQKLISEGKFVETAKVHTNYYGTTYDAVNAVSTQGKLCLLDLDVQGCQTVKQSSLNAYFIFVEPPSMEELERRLTARGKEDAAAMKVRLETAKFEMSFKDKTDLWDSVVMNDDLTQTYANIKAIINKVTNNFLV